MNVSKSRADKCVTHHWACDCREYQMDQMESALRVIMIWAKTGKDLDDVRFFEDIERRCREALGKPRPE